jgi:integrase
MPLGTHGKIRIYPRGNGWMARALVRDWDGVTRYAQKQGRTQAAAQRALVESLRDRQRSDSGALITPDTRVDVLAEAWWSEIEQGNHSPGTRRNYRDRLDRQVIPSLGQLRVRELTTGAIDRHLRVVKEKHGPGTAKLTRTVLSGMCGLAARYDAVDRNPVRDASAITRIAPRKAPQALTAAQAAQLRSGLTYDEKAVKRDLPDFVSMMLATGLRIGEVCAITWDCIDFAAGTVRTGGIVVRVPTKGLQIKTAESSKITPRALRLPSWAVAMLRTRASHFALSNDPVFPAPLGSLRDPSNTQADLRDAFTAAGFEWVTSHVLRKTVATLMDQAGLSARAAADQLGHAKPSMTSDKYFGRGVTDTGAADVLEALA